MLSYPQNMTRQIILTAMLVLARRACTWEVT